jgi:CRISPR-associated endonuclease/helicase Cas3
MTAKLASSFASAFSSEAWGHLAGLWHDIGKYQPEFQRRLRGERLSVEHSGAGAAHAFEQGAADAIPLAFVIAGHHAGLTNFRRNDSEGPSSLVDRLDSNKSLAHQLAATIPGHIRDHKLPARPAFLGGGSNAEQCRRLEFWTRFLFSCLTDADYLDTEQALEPRRAARRPQEFDCGTLLPLIEARIVQSHCADRHRQDTRIDVIRDSSCRPAQ